MLRIPKSRSRASKTKYFLELEGNVPNCNDSPANNVNHMVPSWKLPPTGKFLKKALLYLWNLHLHAELCILGCPPPTKLALNPPFRNSNKDWYRIRLMWNYGTEIRDATIVCVSYFSPIIPLESNLAPIFPWNSERGIAFAVNCVAIKN